MSKLLKKITSDTLIYSVLPQLPKIVNILILPLTTPFLTVLDFAVYGTVLAFIGAFEILKSLGLDIVLLNSFYKTPSRYKIIWGKVEAIISIWSIVLTLLVGVVVYFILPEELTSRDRWTVVLCICVPAMLFAGLSKIGNLYYQFKENPKPIVIRSLVLGLLAIAINYYTIAILKLGYMGWFYSGLITGVLMPLSYIHPIWTREKLLPIYRISVWELKKMLKVSLPMLPHHYAHYFLNFSDRVLLNLLKVPTAQVGIYNLGYSISYNFKFLTTSVDKVIGPAFHKMLATKKDATNIQTIVFILSAGYLAIAFLGSLWMREVFQLLIRNPELSGAYTIAIVILFSFVARPLYNGSSSFLFFEEKTQRLWWVTFSSGILNVILNLIFIPYFGIWAAAINTFVCITASHVGVFFLKDLRQVNPFNFYVAQWLTAILILFGVAWWAKDVLILYKIIITAIALLGALTYMIRINKRMTP